MKIFNLKNLIFVSLAILFIFGAVNWAHADDCAIDNVGKCDISNGCTCPAGSFNSDTQDKINTQADSVAATAGFPNYSYGLGDLIAVIIKTVLSLLALLFMILILVSGFQWMTAGGNEEQVEKAKKRITNALIGLVIVIAAYAITYFVFNIFGGVGGSGANDTTVL